MMKKRMWSLAKRNIKSNALVEIPYFFTTSFLMAALFIICSLMNNSYVRTRHSSLPVLMLFALITLTVFVVISVLYGNNFIYRRRQGEFALYAILGLEKKHMKSILKRELYIRFGRIFVMALVEGFLIGKLFFLSLGSILQDRSIHMGAYPLDGRAVLFLLVFTLLCFVITYWINSRRIHLLVPLAMLQKQRSGEREPKNRYLFLFFGLLFTGAGYWSALRIEDPLGAISIFFLAVLLVMVGTYLLFGSLSIFLLKKLKSRKSYYYQSNHFLFLSRMVYRMRQNAAGLAGIAVIASGILISLSTTFAVYGSLENDIKQSMPMEFKMERSWKNGKIVPKEERNKDYQEVLSLLHQSVKGTEKIEDVNYSFSYMTFGALMGNQLRPVKKTPEEFSKLYYLELEENEEKMKHLSSDEILVTSNHKKIPQTMEFMGKTYRVVKGKDLLDGKIAIAAMRIVLPAKVTLEEAAAYYPNGRSSGYESTLFWNVNPKDPDYLIRLRKELPNEDRKLQSREDYAQQVYSLNGGFVVLGILVSVVLFAIGMLMVYYKQISEAYEDRENIEKMKKVGLSKKMVKNSIRAQLVWLFFLPVGVAVLHSTVASKMMFRLLNLFGVQEYFFYLKFLTLVFGIFFLVYFFFYLYTSKVYLRIVNRGREQERERRS